MCNSKLSGVVSFGREYEVPTYPDVYSSVAYAVDWINTTDGTNGSEKQKVVDIYSVTAFTVLFIALAMFFN